MSLLSDVVSVIDGFKGSTEELIDELNEVSFEIETRISLLEQEQKEINDI